MYRMYIQRLIFARFLQVEEKLVRTAQNESRCQGSQDASKGRKFQNMSVGKYIKSAVRNLDVLTARGHRLVPKCNTPLHNGYIPDLDTSA